MAAALRSTALDEGLRRLAERADEAERLALRLGLRAFASVTVPIDPAVDPSATVLAARGPGERFFCLEQPGRDGYAVCGLGEAIAVTRSGADRFEGAAADCRRIGARTLEDDQAADPGRPPGAGPVFLGGFAFAAAGGATPEWSGFEPAQLVLPELSIARKGDQARLTVTVAVEPRTGAGAEAAERVRRRLRDLAPRDDAAAGPQPDGPPAGVGRGRAVALRGRRPARGRAHPRGPDGQGRAGPRGARADGPRRSIPRRS